MVGGISALIGAALLGPRIGKFNKDENGKVVKVHTGKPSFTSQPPGFQIQ